MKYDFLNNMVYEWIEKFNVFIGNGIISMDKASRVEEGLGSFYNNKYIVNLVPFKFLGKDIREQEVKVLGFDISKVRLEVLYSYGNWYIGKIMDWVIRDKIWDWFYWLTEGMDENQLKEFNNNKEYLRSNLLQFLYIGLWLNLVDWYLKEIGVSNKERLFVLDQLELENVTIWQVYNDLNKKHKGIKDGVGIDLYKEIIGKLRSVVNLLEMKFLNLYNIENSGINLCIYKVDKEIIISSECSLKLLYGGGGSNNYKSVLSMLDVDLKIQQTSAERGGKFNEINNIVHDIVQEVFSLYKGGWIGIRIRKDINEDKVTVYKVDIVQHDGNKVGEVSLDRLNEVFYLLSRIIMFFDYIRLV